MQTFKFMPQLRLRVAVLTAIIILTLGVVPGIARADGDPASDILLSQEVFVPWDASVPTGQAARLEALTAAAARSGYPIRVALIASPADLGSVTALWLEPRSYAEFLGEELSLVYDGRVLVVMPGGFGLYYHGVLLPAEGRVLNEIRPPSAPAGLADAAITAVARLASAAGHPLAPGGVSTAPVTSSSSPSRSSDVVSWLVFLAGLVLIGCAWTASVRVRPLRGPWRRATSA